jgi:hypothetical protein
MKKRQTIMISQLKDELSDDDKANVRPNIFITDESSLELVYTDLLDPVVSFVQNVAELEGNWRDHLKMLQNIFEIVHLFYMPEIHAVLVPILQAFAIEGNNTLRDEATKCLAKIFQYQHHAPARDELLDFIMTRLAGGKNFSLRRTFIWFCKHVVGMIPFAMFKDIFWQKLFAMH